MTVTELRERLEAIEKNHGGGFVVVRENVSQGNMLPLRLCGTVQAWTDQEHRYVVAYRGEGQKPDRTTEPFTVVFLG